MPANEHASKDVFKTGAFLQFEFTVYFTSRKPNYTKSNKSIALLVWCSKGGRVSMQPQPAKPTLQALHT